MVMNMFRKRGRWADTEANIAIHIWQSEGIFVNTNKSPKSPRIRFKIFGCESLCWIAFWLWAQRIVRCMYKSLQWLHRFVKLPYSHLRDSRELALGQDKVAATFLPTHQGCFYHKPGWARYSGSSHWKLNHHAAHSSFPNGLATSFVYEQTELDLNLSLPSKWAEI